MVLDSVEPNSDVVHARGQFDFEWADACDAWTISQNVVLEVGHRNGSVSQFAWSYSAWERKDGAAMRYSITRRYGNGTKEEVRGEAAVSQDHSGSARFSLPEEREISLPAGTLFPGGQTVDLLKFLETGEAPPWRVLFDGSGDDGIYGVSSALARELNREAEVAISSPLIEGHKSWRMNVAFFNMDDSISLPEQEQSFRLFDNGIADELIFDYGDFSVRADLIKIEPIAGGGC